MCEQPTTKRAKALHVAFNYVDPIILVGDERGGVISFKLSKSLTKTAQPKNEEDNRTPVQLEIDKMEKFLSTQDKEVY